MKMIRHHGREQKASTPQGGVVPFTQLNRLRDEINRFFEEPFSLLAPATGLLEGWVPNVDIYEDKDNLTLKAELPGMKKEEIDVSLVGDTLVISGERKEEEESTSSESYRAERFFGRFQRSITLPHPVDSGNIQAAYKDGVLTVTLPKSEEAKRKQIEIKAS